jgi:hypothetical protein
VTEKDKKPKLCYDRRSVGQSLLLSSPIWGPRPDFLLLSNSLRVCSCETPSLTRGRVFHLQLLLVLASGVILGSEYRGTHDHILLAQIHDSPNLETRFPYLYPPGTGWPSYTPRHCVPFPSPPTTRQGYGRGIRTRLHTGRRDRKLPSSIIYLLIGLSCFPFSLLPSHAISHLNRKLNMTDCFHSSPGIHFSEFYVILKQGDCDELPRLSKQARLCLWAHAQ